jgi:hypothetical protein
VLVIEISFIHMTTVQQDVLWWLVKSVSSGWRNRFIKR